MLQVSDIPGVVVEAAQTGIVPYFVGQPGIGKTEGVYDSAEPLARYWQVPKVGVCVIHLPSMGEGDLRGYLILDGKYSRFSAPSFWTLIEQVPSILFFDEMAQAAQENQKAAGQFLQERRMGEFTLPEKCVITAAGNPVDCGAGSVDMLSHVQNKIMHLRVAPPSADNWSAWAAAHGVGWELISFVHKRPAFLATPPPEVANEPYCTPRSLMNLHKLSVVQPHGLVSLIDSEVGLEKIRGVIGEAARTELLAVVRLGLALPSIEDVAGDPDGTPIPAGLSEQYAMMTMLPPQATRQNTAAVVKYMARFPINIALVGLIALNRRERATPTEKRVGLTSVAGYANWLVKNKQTVIRYREYLA